MWLEQQQHLGWKVGRSGIEAKLSNLLLLCLLLPLATTDAVRLGGRGGEGASSFVHTCTALHDDRRGREKRGERKGEEGGEEGRRGGRGREKREERKGEEEREEDGEKGRRGRETEDEKGEGALLLICRGSPYHDHQSMPFLTGLSWIG